MIHEVEEKTRKTCRTIITCIRTRHNMTRKEAEEYFQRALSDTEVIERIMEEVDRDIEEQKEYERYKPA